MFWFDWTGWESPAVTTLINWIKVEKQTTQTVQMCKKRKCHRAHTVWWWMNLLTSGVNLNWVLMKYKYPLNAKLSEIEVLVLSCKPGQRQRLGGFCRPSSLSRTECYHRWESGRHRELQALISGTVVRTKPLCSAPSVKEMDWGKPVWRTRVPSTGRLVSLNCFRPQRQPISSQPLSCLTGLKGILQPYKTDPLQQNIRTTLTFICD